MGFSSVEDEHLPAHPKTGMSENEFTAPLPPPPSPYPPSSAPGQVEQSPYIEAQRRRLIESSGVIDDSLWEIPDLATAKGTDTDLNAKGGGGGGINAGYPASVAHGVPVAANQMKQFHVAPLDNPIVEGMMPPNAIFMHPGEITLRKTFFGDTPAPFICPNCSKPGLSTVKSQVSLAAFVGCMFPMFLGFCFLCPACSWLWHKVHYCDECGQKVYMVKKDDPCLIMDPHNWTVPSYALPA